MKKSKGLWLVGLAAGLCGQVHAQEKGVLGFWKEPEGSVIRVETCGNAVCAVLAVISPTAPARVDGKNPEASLRGRSLCGLRIGDGFQLKTATRAESGKLYDPKSGKTYSGRMESDGDELKLRGYIGVSLLGRTEKWKRVAPMQTCTR